MHSVHDIAVAVKATTMPFGMREQILDQLLGHHDDLIVTRDNFGRPPRRTVRPLSERVAEARKIGAFDFAGTDPNGNECYTYCKRVKVRGAAPDAPGRFVPFYDVLVRDGKAVHCGCEDFKRESRAFPAYVCKHCVLFAEMVQDEEQTWREALDEMERAGGVWHRTWALALTGEATDAAVLLAWSRQQAAQERCLEIAGRRKERLSPARFTLAASDTSGVSQCTEMAAQCTEGAAQCTELAQAA